MVNQAIEGLATEQFGEETWEQIVDTAAYKISLSGTGRLFWSSSAAQCPTT
jgi:hypothetical protein